MEPDKFEKNENFENVEEEPLANEETAKDEFCQECEACEEVNGLTKGELDDALCQSCEENPEEPSDEELTPEELEEILAYSKRRRKKGLIVTAIVAAAIAIAAFMVCAVEGVGGDTVVNHPITAYENEDAALLSSVFHTDNIRYQNPIAALFNRVLGRNKDTAMFIDGEPVSREVFDFVAYSSALNCAYTMLQSGMVSDVSQIDWDEIEETSGLSYGELAKGMAVVDSLTPICALISKAEEFDISFTDEDEAKIDEWLKDLKAEYGDDFEEALKSSGYDSEETLIQIQRLNLYASKVCETIDGKLEEYLSESELKTLLADDKVSVKHILIEFEKDEDGNLTDEAKTKAQNEAKEVLEKIKSGEDFDKLIEEYNDDLGQPDEGYTFANDGSMVQEFADAAFALKVGEVSEPTETVYGYHIIKRTERKADLEDYLSLLQRTADVRINKSVYDSVKVSIDFDVPETDEESEIETAE